MSRLPSQGPTCQFFFFFIGPVNIVLCADVTVAAIVRSITVMISSTNGSWLCRRHNYDKKDH